MGLFDVKECKQCGRKGVFLALYEGSLCGECYVKNNKLEGIVGDEALELEKNSKTDIEYIREILESIGLFQGREFFPSDEFHIEKYYLTVKPHGVSKAEAQKAIGNTMEGCPLNVFAEKNTDDYEILVIKTIDGKLLGDVRCDEDIVYRTLYEMLKAGVSIDCSLAEKGQFWADSLNKKIWWCSITLPYYDIWSLTGANVWTAERGRYYHCDETCDKNANRHMTATEAEYRGMMKCPNCYHLGFNNLSDKELHQLSIQMTGSLSEYFDKVYEILKSKGIKDTDLKVNALTCEFRYKNETGVDFFNAKLSGKLRYITLYVPPRLIHCDYACTVETQSKGPDYCRIYVPSPDALDSISRYIVAAFDRAKAEYERQTHL